MTLPYNCANIAGNLIEGVNMQTLIMNKATTSRYVAYVLVGGTVELVRLGFFRVLEHRSLFVANLISLLVSIVVSFALHDRITWKDREGSTLTKFLRFCGSKGALWAARLASLPLMAKIGLGCPLLDLVDFGVKTVAWLHLPSATLLDSFLSCGVMQAAVVDAVIGFTIGYILHDVFSFKKS